MHNTIYGHCTANKKKKKKKKKDEKKKNTLQFRQYLQHISLPQPRWRSWMRVRLETRRSRVRPPLRSATFFRGD